MFSEMKMEDRLGQEAVEVKVATGGECRAGHGWRVPTSRSVRFLNRTDDAESNYQQAVFLQQTNSSLLRPYISRHRTPRSTEAGRPAGVGRLAHVVSGPRNRRRERPRPPVRHGAMKVVCLPLHVLSRNAQSLSLTSRVSVASGGLRCVSIQAYISWRDSCLTECPRPCT